MARKPEITKKENPVGCTGEGEMKIEKKGLEKVRRKKFMKFVLHEVQMKRK